jgi:WhiB family redox-sensing transcriptional regulator
MGARIAGGTKIVEGGMLPLVGDRQWQDQANCLGVDPDLFFPERGASTREAKEVCRGCVVKQDCLEFALANGEKFGIWGGLSERERRKLRRKQREEGSGAAATA